MSTEELRSILVNGGYRLDTNEGTERTIAALLAIIAEERMDTIKRIKSSAHWERCETCMDCAGSLAVEEESNRLLKFQAATGGKPE